MSRREYLRYVVLIAASWLAVVVGVFTLAASLAVAMAPPVTDPLAVPLGPYAATVVSVHDGDTFTARIALGFGVSVTEQIRIYGINAPELHTGTDAQKVAGRRSADFLAAALPPGTPIRLTVARNRSGVQVQTFTRYVATVERAVAGPPIAASDVAAEMVGVGMAGWADENADPLPGPPPPLAP